MPRGRTMEKGAAARPNNLPQLSLLANLWTDAQQVWLVKTHCFTHRYRGFLGWHEPVEEIHFSLHTVASPQSRKYSSHCNYFFPYVKHSRCICPSKERAFSFIHQQTTIRSLPDTNSSQRRVRQRALVLFLSSLANGQQAILHYYFGKFNLSVRTFLPIQIFEL